MAASFTGFGRAAGTVTCVLLLTLTAGCATIRQVEPGQATIDPGSGVIAFSVETGKHYQSNAWVQPANIQIRYGDESILIRVGNREDGIQRFLLELPAQAVLFYRFEVDAGSGIFWRRYRTGIVQPVQLVRGGITYAGRIRIDDVRYVRNADGSIGRPDGIRLVFVDQSEDDLSTWAREYGIFRARSPQHHIAGNWGGADFLDLWVEDSSGDLANGSLGRALDGLLPDPIRGPMPEGPPQ